MKKIVLLISLILATSSIFAATLTVNQDGSADYTQINLAVSESVDGDTIKVYPGTYEGNILMEDRHDLLIASLYHWTEVDSFKYNTIIDGEMEDFGFRLDLCSDITIQGFTIQNCTAPPPLYEGAAIDAKRSNPVNIFDNIITDNHANWGAGINANSNYPDFVNYINLKGCSIKENYSRGGTGLMISRYSQISMSQTELNSIYNNYGSRGADIYWNSHYPTTIFLDTLSIDLNDDNFSPYYFLDDQGNCNINVQSHSFTLIDDDIYIDRINGDDNNSGSEDNPMQTITHALSRIKSNENSTNIIYINSGVYDQESCNLPYKNNINLIGLSENVILDYSDKMFFNIAISVTILPYIRKLNISRLKIINASGHLAGMLHLSFTDKINLNEIQILSSTLEGSGFKFIYKQFDNSLVTMKQVDFIDFQNGNLLTCKGQNLDIINCSFKNSVYTLFDEWSDKSILNLMGYIYDPDWPTINIINTEISNNEAANNWPGESGTDTAISTGYMTNVNIINSTISNNRGVPSYYHPSGEYGRAIQFWEKDSNVNIVNSIIYGNDQYDLGYKDPGFYEQNNNYSLNVVNSIIGTHEMVLTDNQINFENVWSNDPEFAGEEADYPFALLESSYAVDAGVMNYMDYLPEGFEFPTTDLAGNPRISGNLIDLGAYEYQQPGSSQETEEYKAPKETKITNYPNPGRLNLRGEALTKISLNLANDGKYKLEIYNIKGQKVRTILDAFLARGKHSYAWNGKDKNGRNVSSGTYLIKCELDGEVITTNKMTVVK